MSEYVSQISQILDSSRKNYLESFIVYLSQHTDIKLTDLGNHMENFNKSDGKIKKASKVAELSSTCRYIFTKGKNAGKPCSKKTKDGMSVCPKHVESQIEEDVLVFEKESEIEHDWEEDIEDDIDEDADDDF